MSDPRLQLADPHVVPPRRARGPFGQYLVSEGIITAQDLNWALSQQNVLNAPIGELLVSADRATPQQMLGALAQYFNAQLVDLKRDPPKQDLTSFLPATVCLRYGIIPWSQIGDVLFVATSRPERFPQIKHELERHGKTVIPVVASAQQIRDATGVLFGAELANRAAHKVPPNESCRPQNHPKPKAKIAFFTAIFLMICGFVLFPNWAISISVLFAFATLMMTTTLKITATAARLWHRTAPVNTPVLLPPAAPRVTVLVPLFQEKEIANALLRRLSRLTYPKSLLEVILVLEAKDKITRQTIEDTTLPSWISVVEVPAGGDLTTKPRAMNYALDFCKGDIIGVWDAEDAPEPDQIERVVTRFQSAPDNVACLQGVLDYYNPRANWMARCFTIEYATWWRMIQPGMAQLGLVVPLGGTTLFFRRDILEKLNGWDAHNVTEDADLGVRLARHGYVTEMIATTTYEEANCRPWPWVKQRSRWLKGFMITWLVHMRRPMQLLRDLGVKRFLGVQTIFFATVAQFACAPLLWSFWVTLFGMRHPLEITMGYHVAMGMAALFLIAEICNQTTSMIAVADKEHRHLMKWVPTTLVYYPLGAIAAYKALAELITNPFYWDKTQHGVSKEEMP